MCLGLGLEVYCLGLGLGLGSYCLGLGLGLEPCCLGLVSVSTYSALVTTLEYGKGVSSLPSCLSSLWIRC